MSVPASTGYVMSQSIWLRVLVIRRPYSTWLCQMILPEDHVDQPLLTLIATEMGPNLPSSTWELTHGILTSNRLTTSEVAGAAYCDPSTIWEHRSNLCLFGTMTSPPNIKGRPRCLIPVNSKFVAITSLTAWITCILIRGWFLYRTSSVNRWQNALVSPWCGTISSDSISWSALYTLAKLVSPQVFSFQIVSGPLQMYC